MKKEDHEAFVQEAVQSEVEELVENGLTVDQLPAFLKALEDAFPVMILCYTPADLAEMGEEKLSEEQVRRVFFWAEQMLAQGEDPMEHVFDQAIFQVWSERGGRQDPRD